MGRACWLLVATRVVLLGSGSPVSTSLHAAFPIKRALADGCQYLPLLHWKRPGKRSLQLLFSF